VVTRKSPSYVPERGDIVWIDFSPQAGHEQVGTRPALVVSPLGYNSRTGLALLCPITSRAKGYWFEVTVPESPAIKGFVLADQMRNVDWRVRRARKIAQATASVVNEVLEKLDTLLRPTA
jgi:mRNA interferase MazF